jgi:ABC-type nitrate/sulfonate/bicarbonate transport system permease component
MSATGLNLDDVRVVTGGDVLTVDEDYVPETSALVKRSLAQRALRRLSGVLPGTVLIAAVVCVWQLIVRSMDVAIIYIPAPSDILSEVFDNGRYFFDHARTTMSEAAWGFLYGVGVAIVLAMAMAEFRVVERALLPLCVIIKVTPSVALAPVFIIMMGFGSGPKVVVAALTVFYAALINAVTGFKDVDRDGLELLHSVDASRWEIFRRLRVPSALPHLFAAAKICAPLAVLGAVFSEMQTSRRGLGNVILTASHNINMVRLWGAIFVLMFIGVVLVGLVGALERRVLRWHTSQSA